MTGTAACQAQKNGQMPWFVTGYFFPTGFKKATPKRVLKVALQ